MYITPPTKALPWYNIVMSIREIVFSTGEFYHIYSRGVDRRIIFLDDGDRSRFIRLLFLCNGSIPVIYRNFKDKSLNEIEVEEKLVAVGAYCLMPNHFHVLIKEIKDGGLAKFMSKLLTAYSSYFNKKYERRGALFSSKFGASHLNTDEYLKYIFAYIHLNPLKIIDSEWRKKIVESEWAKKYLVNYQFSSYLDYLGQKRVEESLILNRTEFPDYFEAARDFENYIYDWINFDPELYQGIALVKANGDNLSNT